MRTAKTGKQAVVMSEQELGDKSAKAMDLLSLAISKGREMKEQISLIKLLTVQVENNNREKQATTLSTVCSKTISEIKNDVIAGLEQILDGYEPFIQRMALFTMLGRFDIKGVDDDVFMDEFARRLGGLPLSARKSFGRIFNACSGNKKLKKAS